LLSYVEEGSPRPETIGDAKPSASGTWRYGPRVGQKTEALIEKEGLIGGKSKTSARGRRKTTRGGGKEPSRIRPSAVTT